MPGRSWSPRPTATILDRRDEVLCVDGDAAAPLRHAPPHLRRRLDPQRQRRLRPLPSRRRARIRCARARASPTATASSTEREREYNYELGGDYEFGLGGGRLKLIGLQALRAQPLPPDPDPDLRRRPPDASASASPRPPTRPRRSRAANIAGAAARADWQVSARGRAQPARHRERPVRARPGRRLRAGALPQLRRDRRGAARRGDAHLWPAAVAER